MSGVIDGVAEFTDAAVALGDALVELGVEAVKGAAYLGKAAFDGAVALAKMSGQAVKDVGEAVGGAFAASVNEMAELLRVVTEENRRYRAAYDQYVARVTENKDQQQQFVTKLAGMVTFDALGIDAHAQKRLRGLPNEQQIDTYNQLITLQSRFQELGTLFYELAEQGLELDCENQYIAVKKQLADTVNQGRDDLAPVAIALDDLVRELRQQKLQLTNQDVVSLIDAKLFRIENELGLPQLAGFSDELYELLRVTPDDPDSPAVIEKKLFEIEKETLALVQLFNQFDYEFPEKPDILPLIQSIRSILQTDDSALTKLKSVEMRYHYLMDTYKKVQARDGEVIALKQRYNQAISANYHYKQVLGLPLPQFAFHYETAEQELTLLEAENKQLAAQAAERARQDYVKKTMREIMKSMQYDYLCSDSKQVADKTIERDVYHLENGNVVAVTFVDNHINYSVSGVKMLGVAEDKTSVVNTMHKFCSKTKTIQQQLAQKGINLTIHERLEPAVKYAREIELPHANATVMARLRAAKLNQTAGSAQKKRVLPN